MWFLQLTKRDMGTFLQRTHISKLSTNGVMLHSHFMTFRRSSWSQLWRSSLHCDAIFVMRVLLRV